MVEYLEATNYAKEDKLISLFSLYNKYKPSVVELI